MDTPTTTFRLDGAVASIILPRILAFTGFTFAICSLDYWGYPIYLKEIGDLTTNVVYNLVLGLLLVFRTNTAYDRFWIADNVDQAKGINATISTSPLNSKEHPNLADLSIPVS